MRWRCWCTRRGGPCRTPRCCPRRRPCSRCWTGTATASWTSTSWPRGSPCFARGPPTPRSALRSSCTVRQKGVYVCVWGGGGLGEPAPVFTANAFFQALCVCPEVWRGLLLTFLRPFPFTLPAACCLRTAAQCAVCDGTALADMCSHAGWACSVLFCADLDGNGFISLSEMQRYLTSVFRIMVRGCAGEAR